MPVKAQCPYCFAVYRVAREKIGLNAKCSKCGATFRLSAMPDDTPDIGEAQAKAGFVEVRGPFGLPRWVMPAVGLAAFVFILGYLVYRVSAGGGVEQIGPSKEVSNRLIAARELARQGKLLLAEAKYRHALALADRLGPAGEEIRGIIRDELQAVKEDAKLPIIITQVTTAKSLEALPDGPELGRRQRLLRARGMSGEPEIDEAQHLVQIHCTIQADKIESSTFNDLPVIQFKADDIMMVDNDQARYRAVGFKIEDRYRHRRLIIYPPPEGREPLSIGIVFVMPADASPLRLFYRDLPSSRVR